MVCKYSNMNEPLLPPLSRSMVAFLTKFHLIKYCRYAVCELMLLQAIQLCKDHLNIEHLTVLELFLSPILTFVIGIFHKNSITIHFYCFPN